MGILKDFRATLGGDPQPWHQRMLRAGVRPIELAGAVQQYLRDHQKVDDDGVTVPNVLRITLGTQDHERLGRYGVILPRALGAVVVETADERDWALAGPVKVRIEHDAAVRAGTYRLVGRVEPVDGWGEAPGDAHGAEARGATGDARDAEARGATGDAASDAAGATAGVAGVAALAAEDSGPGSDPADDGQDRGVDDAVDHGADLAPEAPLVPTLTVRSGVDAGLTLVLAGGRLTAGRGEGCDLTIRDTTVSREHAAFVLRGDTWWVLDLGSTNGTRVNGLRAAEHPVITGDRIELGDVVVELLDA